MEECELCGRTTKDVYVVDVENVELRTCASCAKGKKVTRTELDSKKIKTKNSMVNFTKPKRQSPEDEELIDDYGIAMRKAREQMKLPIKVLAEMINEKEHLLVRVEEQKTHPSIDLTKKLEHILKIKMTQMPPEERVQISNKKSSGVPTIGDFVEVE